MVFFLLFLKHFIDQNWGCIWNLKFKYQILSIYCCCNIRGLQRYTRFCVFTDQHRKVYWIWESFSVLVGVRLLSAVQELSNKRLVVKDHLPAQQWFNSRKGYGQIIEALAIISKESLGNPHPQTQALIVFGG